MSDIDLKYVPAADMVKELAERGAIKILAHTTYLPGVVIQRASEELKQLDPVQHAMASGTQHLLHELIREQLIDVRNEAATEAGFPDAPPTDRVITAEVFTANPHYKED